LQDVLGFDPFCRVPAVEARRCSARSGIRLV